MMKKIFIIMLLFYIPSAFSQEDIEEIVCDSGPLMKEELRSQYNYYPGKLIAIPRGEKKNDVSQSIESREVRYEQKTCLDASSTDENL